MTQVDAAAYEAELVRRARAGDIDASRRRFRGELQLHCYRIVGSLQDAEDLVQETLVAAWRGLEGFKGRASCAPGCTGSRPTGALNPLRDRARRLPELRRRPSPSAAAAADRTAGARLAAAVSGCAAGRASPTARDRTRATSSARRSGWRSWSRCSGSRRASERRSCSATCWGSVPPRPRRCWTDRGRGQPALHRARRAMEEPRRIASRRHCRTRARNARSWRASRRRLSPATSPASSHY